MDGQDGNGLQLENIRQTFPSFVLVSCKTHWKTYYGLHPEGEVLNKVLYGEAPPGGSNPYPLIY